MYELVYSSLAVHQLEKLDEHMQERILLTLERLRIRPMSCNVKRLVGMEGYRFRIGDYRVIFDIEQEKLRVLVLQIGHRKNIYD